MARTRRSTTAWSLEPIGCIRAHFRGSDGRGGRAGATDDRYDTPQGASHGGESAAKGAVSHCIGPTKGGLNSKLHAVCDERRPILLLLTEGQMSDHKGAALILPALPPSRELLADRG